MTRLLLALAFLLVALPAQAYVWTDVNGDEMAAWAASILDDNIVNFDAATIAVYQTAASTGASLGRQPRMGQWGDSITHGFPFWENIITWGYEGDLVFDFGEGQHRCKDKHPGYYFYWEDICYWNAINSAGHLGAENGWTLNDWYTFAGHPAEATLNGNFGWATFMLGTNDLIQDTIEDLPARSAWKAMYKAACEEALALGVCIVPSTLPPWLGDYTGSQYATVDTINTMVLEVCTELDLAYIDFNGAIRDFQNVDPSDINDDEDDGGWYGHFMEGSDDAQPGVHPDDCGNDGIGTYNSLYEASLTGSTSTCGQGLRTFLSLGMGFRLMTDVFTENVMPDITGIWVDWENGSSEGTGEPAKMFKTINQGLSVADIGDTVYVRDGIYGETFWMRRGVVVKSENQWGAKISSGDADVAVRFGNAGDTYPGAASKLDGFEIYGENESGDGSGSGLIEIHADSVSVVNCYVHDAPLGADVIKVIGNEDGTSNYVTIQGNILTNPGRRVENSSSCSHPWYQEIIDVFGRNDGSSAGTVENFVLKDNWLFHENGEGDWLVYVKIAVKDALYDGNIFGPSAGDQCGNVAAGIGTSEGALPDGTEEYVVDGAIVKNNIILACKGDGAFGFANSTNVQFFDNLLVSNSGPNLDAVIQIFNDEAGAKNGLLEIRNNNFQSNAPFSEGTVSDGELYNIRAGQDSMLLVEKNNYYGNVQDSDWDYTTENQATYIRSVFAAPAIPDSSDIATDAVATIKGWYAIDGAGGLAPIKYRDTRSPSP